MKLVNLRVKYNSWGYVARHIRNQFPSYIRKHIDYRIDTQLWAQIGHQTCDNVQEKLDEIT